MNKLLIEFVNINKSRFLSKKEIENYYVFDVNFLDSDDLIMNIVISIKPKNDCFKYNDIIDDFELMKWHKIKVNEYLMFKRLKVLNKIKNRQLTNFIIKNTKSF